MKEEKYIEEKILKNNPKSIPIRALDIIIPKSKENICKIYCNDGSQGTGFFCNIPNDSGIMKVLMTNNHVLKEEDIQIGKTIKLSLNNEKIFYEILMDEPRKIYTNKIYDITIIELKQKDKLDKISFFDIDNRIFQENFREIFLNEQIYLLHYPKGNEMEYSIGFIKSINEDNYNIYHSCDSNSGSSGGSIINSTDYRVIAIHKGGAEGNKNYNLATFLKCPIEEFISKNNINENNNIQNVQNVDIKENKKKEIYENINKDKLIKENNNINDDINEIIIQYKIDNIEYSKDIRIFGDEFVKNNKDKSKIVINGSEFELSTHLNINKKQLNKNIFEIKLKDIKRITKMSEMFKGEYNDLIPLFSLPDISQWNTQNVTKMNDLFNDCWLLSSLSDISKWNTQNVYTMSNMFRNCSSLSSLPDISKWNTQKVSDILGMFYGCNSLTSLPDISKWNFHEEFYDICYLFSGCKSLISLPDISKWNTQNVTHMNDLFNGCSSMSSLPDISKWNTQNVSTMSNMFRDCSSLSNLPDISKWDTKSVIKMDYMFYGCSSLSFLPNISKWGTKSVYNMDYMFFGCSSLSSLPDISKWNIERVYEMRSMFENCSSLSSLPDISKWNVQGVSDMRYMFCGCESLLSLPDISKWNAKKALKSYMFSGTKNLKIPEEFEEKEKKECIIF